MCALQCEKKEEKAVVLCLRAAPALVFTLLHLLYVLSGLAMLSSAVDCIRSVSLFDSRRPIEFFVLFYE